MNIDITRLSNIIAQSRGHGITQTRKDGASRFIPVQLAEDVQSAITINNQDITWAEKINLAHNIN